MWTEGDAPLTGTAIFGVGARDEPAYLAGITHLTEHLLLRSMGEIVPLHDGVTTADTVRFYATGTSAEVAAFFNHLFDVIANPQVSDTAIELERRIIEAENPARFGPGAGLLTYRYGIEGIGSCHAGTPTLASITADEVITWIRTWFTDGNAHLTFTGQPPDTLSSALPTGLPRSHPISTRVITAPTLVASENSGVAISLLVDTGLSYFVTDALAAELSADLRHGFGLIYSVDPQITAVEPCLDQVDLVLDPLAENVATVVERSVRVLQRVAREGFGAHAVESARSAAITGLWSHDAWHAYVDELAAIRLVGGEAASPIERLDQACALRPEQLSAEVNRALSSLIVAYDEEVDLPGGLAEDLGLIMDPFEPSSPGHPPRRGPGHRWTGNWFSIRDWIRLDGTQLHEHIFGETRTTDLADVVVAGIFGDGALHLLDRRGRHQVIEPILWRRGRLLIDRVLAAIPDVPQRSFQWHDRDRGAHE